MKFLQIVLLLVAGALAGIVITSLWLTPHRPDAQQAAPAETPTVPVTLPVAPPDVRPAAPPSVSAAPAPIESPPAKKATPKPIRKPVPSMRAAVKSIPAPTHVPTPLPIAPTPPSAPPAPAAAAPADSLRTPHSVTLNAGLIIPVRLVAGLSLDTNQPGDTFVATIDQEIVVDGFVIVEYGAPVEGRITAVDREGSRLLTVELTRLYTSDRQRVAIRTEGIEQTGLPPGTRIQFRLQSAVRLTEKLG